jgi:mRNA interferase HigB
MHVISRKRRREFWKLYPRAEAPLRAWHKVARQEDWQTFADVRAFFPNAD